MPNEETSRRGPEIGEDRVAELREALLKVALGGTTQDTEMVTEIGPEGQPVPVATKTVKREFRPDAALIREILGSDERIGGPRDYC